jgi:hypothetical protein
MWHMKWLSRLKRFKLDSNSEDESSDPSGDEAHGATPSANQQSPGIMNQAQQGILNGLGGGVQIDDFILH